METSRKTINVVAALIRDGKRVFVTARGYDYPEFHLSMRCYWCSLISGNLVLKEAEDAKWLDVETIDSVKWLPADITLIDEIKKRMA